MFFENFSEWLGWQTSKVCQFVNDVSKFEIWEEHILYEGRREEKFRREVNTERLITERTTAGRKVSERRTAERWTTERMTLAICRGKESRKSTTERWTAARERQPKIKLYINRTWTAGRPTLRRTADGGGDIRKKANKRWIKMKKKTEWEYAKRRTAKSRKKQQRGHYREEQ